MKKIIRFLKGKRGDEAVQMAILFPILLLIIAFMTDRFIQYEGITATASSANEALRFAVVAKSADEAFDIGRNTLEDRLTANKIGWCINPDDVQNCRSWSGSSYTKDVSKFNRKGASEQYLFSIDGDGEWCNGNNLTIGVRAHKSSLLPSFSNFRQLMNGPVYHTHTYVIRARIESNKLCKGR